MSGQLLQTLSMYVSNPDVISVLQWPQWIVVGSLKFGPREISFLSFWFSIILKSPVRTWPWSGSQNSELAQSHDVRPIPVRDTTSERCLESELYDKRIAPISPFVGWFYSIWKCYFEFFMALLFGAHLFWLSYRKQYKIHENHAFL